MVLEKAGVAGHGIAREPKQPNPMHTHNALTASKQSVPVAKSVPAVCLWGPANSTGRKTCDFPPTPVLLPPLTNKGKSGEKQWDGGRVEWDGWIGPGREQDWRC